MKYIKVKWSHDIADEPVWLYSELDDASCEVRKVEVFSDGKMGFAGSGEEGGSTRLSTVPIPPIEEIESDAQFEPTEISHLEFEQIWLTAREMGSTQHHQ